MARHRSPRGRRAHLDPSAPALRRSERPSSRRTAFASSRTDGTPVAVSFPGPLGSTPVRRGAAVVAVAGGALSLMGAAAPAATPQVADVAALTDLTSQADAPEMVLVSSVLPVVPDNAPADTEVLDDPAPLVKAMQLAEERIAQAEEERVAAEERAREQAERDAAEAAEAERRASIGADCGLNTGPLGAVKDYVREAAEFLGCLFGEPTMHGVAGRAGTSDHPSGKAIDFMVDRATGDQLADCALRNMDSLGISYVIWEQRINTGSGWEPMEDRGGATANHMDHVHISFDSAGSGDLGGC